MKMNKIHNDSLKLYRNRMNVLKEMPLLLFERLYFGIETGISLWILNTQIRGINLAMRKRFRGILCVNLGEYRY